MFASSKEQTLDVVQKFIQALAGRDLESLLPLFAEEVDWFIPGNEELAPWLGKRRTKVEVHEFFNLLWKNTKPISAQVEHILVEHNFAVIVGEFRTQMLKTEKIVNSIFSIHFTIENGSIVRYRLLEDSYAVSVSLTL